MTLSSSMSRVSRRAKLNGPKQSRPLLSIALVRGERTPANKSRNKWGCGCLAVGASGAAIPLTWLPESRRPQFGKRVRNVPLARGWQAVHPLHLAFLGVLCGYFRALMGFHFDCGAWRFLLIQALFLLHISWRVSSTGNCGGRRCCALLCGWNVLVAVRTRCMLLPADLSVGQLEWAKARALVLCIGALPSVETQAQSLAPCLVARFIIDP